MNVHNANNEINFDNYIISELNVKDKDVNKNIKILNSYEGSFTTNPDKFKEDNIFKKEEEIKKCKIEIKN